jgi:hypothetical protein
VQIPFTWKTQKMIGIKAMGMATNLLKASRLGTDNDKAVCLLVTAYPVGSFYGTCVGKKRSFLCR